MRHEETIGILTDHWQGSSYADEARFLLATALFGRNRRSAAVGHFEALVRKYPGPDGCERTCQGKPRVVSVRLER